MVVYAALLGILLASYIVPLQQVAEARQRVPELEAEVRRAESHNDARRRTIEELNTPEGVERAARERYGMVRPGEEVYIVPDEAGSGEPERDGRP